MEWFLIKQNEHSGPFSEDAIHQLFSNKEIVGNTYIWREGWKEAQTYSKTFLEVEEVIPPEHVGSKKLVKSKENPILDIGDLPPDLPPIPLDAIPSVRKKNVELAKTQIPHLEITPSESNQILKKVKKIKPAFSSNSLKNNQTTISKIEPSVEKGNKSFFRKVKIVMSLTLLIFIAIPSLLYYQSKTSMFSRPNLMTMRDYKKLKMTAMSDESELKFSFALSKDKKSIWIATNNPAEGEIYVNMKSITNRSLGKTVEFNASGKLDNKLVVLNKFQFLKGSRFVDGLYSVELSTTEKLNIPLHHKFFTTHNTEFKYVDQTVVTSLSIKDFKRQLSKYLKMKKSNSNEFWIEITEKYKTVKMITGQIRDGIKDIFNGEPEDWNKKIVEFENKYKTNWGQFFTAFVKANELSYKRYVSEKVEDPVKVLATYNNLSKLAIMIGEESMSSLEALQAFNGKDETSENKILLQEKTTEKLSGIIDKCEEKILEIKTY
ncbi:MAG: hypothetical protein ACJAS4_004052 [Bacteriovoracaceae bacterium]|jgi:hypothetical protein